MELEHYENLRSKFYLLEERLGIHSGDLDFHGIDWARSSLEIIKKYLKKNGLEKEYLARGDKNDFSYSFDKLIKEKNLLIKKTKNGKTKTRLNIHLPFTMGKTKKITDIIGTYERLIFHLETIRIAYTKRHNIDTPKMADVPNTFYEMLKEKNRQVRQVMMEEDQNPARNKGQSFDIYG